MGSLKHIFWLGTKELRAVLTDAVMVVMILFTFTGMVYMEATSLPENVNNASIAIVDEDNSALSRQIASAFYPPYFQPAVQIGAADVAPAMDAGKFLFVLSIPPGFEADLRRGHSPDVLVTIDATAVMQAGLGDAYIQNIVSTEVTRFLNRSDTVPPPPITNEIRRAFNPNGETTWFSALTSILDFLNIIIIMLTGAALVREREHGTIEHLMVMPLRAVEIAMAKIWANGLLILGAFAISMIVVVEGAAGCARGRIAMGASAGGVAVPVRRFGHWHPAGHGGAHHGAVRLAGAAHRDADDAAVRRDEPDRKPAGDVAAGDCAPALASLHVLCSGGGVSRCRSGRGLARLAAHHRVGPGLPAGQPRGVPPLAQRGGIRTVQSGPVSCSVRLQPVNQGGQIGHRIGHPRHQVGIICSHLFIHRHENLVDAIHIPLCRLAPVFCLPLSGDPRHVHHGADVIPFRRAHWPACLLNGGVDAELVEGLHETPIGVKEPKSKLVPAQSNTTALNLVTPVPFLPAAISGTATDQSIVGHLPSVTHKKPTGEIAAGGSSSSGRQVQGVNQRLILALHRVNDMTVKPPLVLGKKSHAPW